MTAATNTIRLHRVLRAPVERVYRAVLDPDALCKWMPPNGFVGKIHQMDANIVQEGVPAVIPPEACYLGWGESLALLAKLVEAEIPN